MALVTSSTVREDGILGRIEGRVEKMDVYHATVMNVCVGVIWHWGEGSCRFQHTVIILRKVRSVSCHFTLHYRC